MMANGNSDQKPLAIVRPTPLKRAVSIFILVMLGMVLVFLALSQAFQSLIWPAFLLFFGVAILVLAEAMRRATALTLILFPDRLQDSSGRLICRLDDIAGIDRGAFAFKPSNGFLIRTKSRTGRHWAPGLWWRMGRKIGVGGVTPAGPGKFMAELISAKLAERGVT